MFELKTRNRSCVRPRIHGIESTANSRSLNSTTTRAANMGVAQRRPSTRSRKPLPRDSALYGMKHVKQRIIQELPSLWASACQSSSPSSSPNILYADHSKSPPKRYTMHVKRSMRATPAKMKTVRKTTAPRMPHFKTGPCRTGLMRNALKMSAITTRLSTLRLFSSRYPVRNVKPTSAPLETARKAAKARPRPSHATLEIRAPRKWFFSAARREPHARSPARAAVTASVKKTQSLHSATDSSGAAISCRTGTGCVHHR
mmetsp:Transcript_63478/g.138253  ORF Transcript_63478/g.138253 Transcript_63478/m.138253 type:complete len:258 (-) Transcript_63478:23-796(-)